MSSDDYKHSMHITCLNMNILSENSNVCFVTTEGFIDHPMVSPNLITDNLLDRPQVFLI